MIEKDDPTWLLLKGLQQKIDFLLTADERDYVDEDQISICDEALSEAIKSFMENRQFYRDTDWGFLTSITERYNNTREDAYWETFCAWDAPEFSMVELTEYVNPDGAPHPSEELIRKLWCAVRDRDLKCAEVIFDQVAAEQLASSS